MYSSSANNCTGLIVDSDQDYEDIFSRIDTSGDGDIELDEVISPFTFLLNINSCKPQLNLITTLYLSICLSISIHCPQFFESMRYIRLAMLLRQKTNPDIADHSRMLIIDW
jgi:hypothetical protein